MKTLFIRTTNSFSGAERYNVELLTELQKYKDTTLLTNLDKFDGYDLKVRIEKWLPEEVGTKRQLLRALLYSFIFTPRYLLLIKNFDIVCLQSRTEMIFLTLVLRVIGKKVVWIQHGPLFNSNVSKIVLLLYFYAALFPNKIIAVSEDTKKDLIEGDISKYTVEVIHIGVHVPVIKMLIHPFTVGFLGTVTKEKGIDEFVNFVTKRKVHAMVIGDGPDRRLIPKQIQQTGFVKDVYPYLRKIDVLFLPTRHHEGISMAILEAMSLGIPVVTTDIGGNREIIKNGYNGLLIKPEAGFDMNQDWKTMGKHARETVINKFNIKTQVKKFAELFNNL